MDANEQRMEQYLNEWAADAREADMTKCDWCGVVADASEMTDIFGCTRCKDVAACAARNGQDLKPRARYRLTWALERVQNDAQEDGHGAQ